MKKGTIGLLLGLIGLISSVVVFFVTLSSLVRGVSPDEQFSASGSFKVSASEKGRYYVWNNYLTVFDGAKVAFSPEFPKDIDLTFLGENTQEWAFTLDDQHGWRIGNHSKRSVGYIETQQPSDITIQVRGGDGTRVLSFSKADELADVWRHLRGFAYSALFLFMGLAMGIWGMARRIRRV